MIEYKPRTRFGRSFKPSPTNVNLQAEHNHKVTITLDDETKSLIERFNETLEFIGKRLDALRNTSDEPAELSINIPEHLMEPEKAYNVVPGPKWNETVNIKWREENGNLIIKYKNGEVTTDWETVKDLAEMEEKARYQTIREILDTKFTANKRTAYSQFAEHLARGKIQAPVENPFLDEMDPFAPVLAGLNLTKVDPNCGNGEEMI